MQRIATFLAAVAAIVFAASMTAGAQTSELPPRKPGQWDVKMVTEKPANGPSVDMQMCLDAATDRELMNFGLRMSKDTCKRYDMKRAGPAWVIDAECTFGPVASVTRTTITGDFQSAVVVRTEGTTEGMPGAGKGPQPTLMTQVARWTGATCAAGMAAGDISLGGGIKLNVKQLKSLQNILQKVQIR
jgi:hypothetical protein